jgi:ABC-type transport system involved in cytochrome c biogenesis ATPase subunit
MMAAKMELEGIVEMTTHQQQESEKALIHDISVMECGQE